MDKQLLRACASLGIRLVHSRPGQPAGRGKIERAFRTVRDQFLVEIGSGRELDDLAQLNTLFTAWVETVYHRRTHSETGQAPFDRWSVTDAPAAAVARAAAGGVPVVGVAHRHQDRHRRPARQHLRSRRRPGRPQGRAGLRPVRPHQHRGPLARPVDGTRGPAQDRPARAPQSPTRRHHPQPPAPTGIDYLHLVEAQHTAELAERCSYSRPAELSSCPTGPFRANYQLPGTEHTSDDSGEVSQ